ncbi:MAG: MBL fold metallo-hydrolase [Chromatiales bacterium]
MQSNQFLIIDGPQGALIDPGGELVFSELSAAVAKEIPLDKLDYIIASHQDPDVIASLGSWVSQTDATVVCSRLWIRFLPHLLPRHLGDSLSERCLALADRGDELPLGRSVIKVVPAHFLHSVGNFQFYDPVSRILFSGDMGASILRSEVDRPIESWAEFRKHIPYMRPFHQRYMASNKVCRLWAEAVRKLDLEMVVPQHGRAFKGPEAIGDFLHWISHLACGVDLATSEHYEIP